MDTLICEEEEEELRWAFGVQRKWSRSQEVGPELPRRHLSSDRTF